MYTLKVISGSVRPGRKGPIMARWIAEFAKANTNFTVETIDLGEVGLPLLDEPLPASMGKYEHTHTKEWSAQIAEADAFIFVTPEYNGNYPASLRNAMEFLYKEWAHKAAGILSYGYSAGGARAAKALAGDLTILNVMPLPKGITLVNFPQFIVSEEEGGKEALQVTEATENAAKGMLEDLMAWTEALSVLRKK
jgi:NAD(P)H-dependent FMN reductase